MCKILFDVNGGSICKLKSASVYVLLFAKKDSIIILNKIYKKNVLCLSRKKKVALKILGKWRNW